MIVRHRTRTTRIFKIITQVVINFFTFGSLSVLFRFTFNSLSILPFLFQFHLFSFAQFRSFLCLFTFPSISVLITYILYFIYIYIISSVQAAVSYIYVSYLRGLTVNQNITQNVLLNFEPCLNSRKALILGLFFVLCCMKLSAGSGFL